MLVKLPNGLIDGADLFNIVEVDEIRGKQQNYLVDKNLLENLGHVPKILEDLVKSFQTEQGLHWKGSIKEAIWKITIGDIETILVKIRENTYGPKLYHEGTCEHCNHVNKNILTELDKLEVTTTSFEELVKSKIVVLPKSKLEVEFKLSSLRTLFDVFKIAKEKPDKFVTETLALSIKRIGNNEKSVSEMIEELPASDITFLGKEHDKLVDEGSIDTNIEIECIKCKKDFSIKLNCFDPSFFYPTEESTN